MLVAHNNPSVAHSDTGAIQHYSVSPALPPGLNLDSTGFIYGTPTAAQDTSSYLITGTNVAGFDTETVRISVVNPPTALSYARNADTL